MRGTRRWLEPELRPPRGWRERSLSPTFERHLLCSEAGAEAGQHEALHCVVVNYREFLLSPIAYLPPHKALEGLSNQVAETRAPGTPHSIAEIVAHLAFWQDWFYDRCAGRPTPMVRSAALGWPAVSPGTWPQISEAFLNRLQQLADTDDAAARSRLTPPIEFPPLANYTVADALIHVATHNSHHMGQIILLRQLHGAWPPPAGSWTW
jgi:uncharacterized damage-inducible protein DinB